MTTPVPVDDASGSEPTVADVPYWFHERATTVGDDSAGEALLPHPRPHPHARQNPHPSAAADAGSLHRPRAHRHKLRNRLLGGGLGAVLVLVLLAVFAVFEPVPFLDDYLKAKVAGQVAAQLACPGSAAPAVRVDVGGGRVLPQLLHDRLSQVHLVVPDTAIGGAQHARVEATLTGVSGLRSSAQRTERIESSTTIAFADMPAPATGPRPAYGRAADGSLTLTVPLTDDLSRGVASVLFLSLSLRGESVIATPRQLLLFKKMIPAGEVSGVTGGVRVTPLPHLPAGLKYTSVSVTNDGVHVGLNGVVVTPLSSLPPVSNGKKVRYSVRNGLLGITSSAIDLEPIFSADVTIWVAPQLQGNKLVMVPQSVTALGEDRPTSDWIASLVLEQIDPASLVTSLPTVPSGVSYKSASVDSQGVKVVVGGVTVSPFSKMPPSGNGLPTTYGAQNGFLTVTTTGMPDTGGRSTITLFSVPRIVGTTMDVSPQQIEVLGARFPAADVLSEIGAQNTTYRLDVLPAGMSYAGVDVPPGGIRVLVSGKNVTLGRGLPGRTCPAPAGH